MCWSVTLPDQKQQLRPPLRHARGIGLAVLVAVAVATGACAETERPAGPVVSDPGPVHVHGLGVNPRDGAVFIATHTGLFRAGDGETEARRVAGRYQDTMGFAIAGSDRFVGSGHPDAREALPPFLGLIETEDAGKTWKPRSLQGKMDFHVLEAAGRRLYGSGTDFRSREERLLSSGDGGRTWRRLRFPQAVLDLAVDPRDAETLVVSSPSALRRSEDGGRRWQRLRGAPGLVAWPQAQRLYAVGAGGVVRLSSDGGGRWREVGQVGGEPTALHGTPRGELLVALEGGVIKRSVDEGRSWTVRSRP